MRLMVFFDLPVKLRTERRAYAQFRRFLQSEGYDMLQFSVYARLVNGNDDMEKHVKRLCANLPPQGSVRYLQISERQFSNMKMLVGEASFQEKKVNASQLLLF
ncbi:CRISPR-associated endonuclease Cas2 [Massilia sp. W12]|uniref:CRISPR-associated endonuclease Cas2 n=1 Tax=Massilia sp. W12 TaxID=3126507 RepID=UPI0030CB5F83